MNDARSSWGLSGPSALFGVGDFHFRALLTVYRCFLRMQDRHNSIESIAVMGQGQNQDSGSLKAGIASFRRGIAAASHFHTILFSPDTMNLCSCLARLRQAKKTMINDRAMHEFACRTHRSSSSLTVAYIPRSNVQTGPLSHKTTKCHERVIERQPYPTFRFQREEMSMAAHDILPLSISASGYHPILLQRHPQGLPKRPL